MKLRELGRRYSQEELSFHPGEGVRQGLFCEGAGWEWYVSFVDSFLIVATKILRKMFLTGAHTHCLHFFHIGLSHREGSLGSHFLCSHLHLKGGASQHSFQLSSGLYQG